MVSWLLSSDLNKTQSKHQEHVNTDTHIYTYTYTTIHANKDVIWELYQITNSLLDIYINPHHIICPKTEFEVSIVFFTGNILNEENDAMEDKR